MDLDRRHTRHRFLLPFTRLVAVAGCLAMSLACAQETPPAASEVADLVIRGGKIVTLDEATPEAEAIAVSEGRIVALGSAEDLARWIGEGTEVVELEGHLVIPGFVESHAHFLGLGDARLQLPLNQTSSWAEVVAMVAEAAAKAEPGEWIRGRGWHQDKWSDEPPRTVSGFPTHDQLSEVAPSNPVLLTHASGHALIANAKAMELAGIDDQTPDPDGGDIVRDEAGKATGLFNETAEGLIHAAREHDASTARAETLKRVELASRECQAKGVTSFHDAGTSFEQIDLLHEAAKDGSLGVRLWMMAAASNEVLAEKLASYRTDGGLGDNDGSPTVAVGGIKKYMDGALGSRGAWLLEPYSDQADTSGLQTSPIEELEETARLAIENGYQLCVHAIGDRANREVLDIYERTFAAHPDTTDQRWRVEHAQHLDPEDISRFAELGVIASVQTVHCTSDGPWVPERIGDARAEAGAYVWQKLLDSGATVINGTDAPVEDVDPIANFHSAISRKLPDGSAFYGDQALGRVEALRSMTLDAAYGAFQEDDLGSLEVGKLADMVVLSKDILEVPESEIHDTEVLYTVLGGKVVHRAPAP